MSPRRAARPRYDRTAAVVLLLAVVASPALAQTSEEALFQGVRLGMTKAELTALPLGLQLRCQSQQAADPPGTQAQSCAAPSGLTLVLATDQGRAERVIAIAHRGPAANADHALQVLKIQWGDPNGAVAAPRGAISWSKAAKQISFDRACQAETYCIEYSDSAFARRAARSLGLFKPVGF